MRLRRAFKASIPLLCIATLSWAQTATPQAGAASDSATTHAGHRSADHDRDKVANNNTPSEVGGVMQRTGGSLLKASLSVQRDPGQARLNEVSFFAVPAPEPKSLRKHDLITVIVREESAISSKSTKEFKKEADLSAKLDQFIKLSLKDLAIRGLPTSANPADIDINGIREFKGNGELDREDSLTARITAEVVDVKPNGTLVVQARKKIKTDEEEQQFVLTGICRVEDVNADNTILSTQLFDLQLQKNHKGDVREAVHRGWLPKLLDALNPF